MAGLCKYRDAFGKPGEGAHAWRVGGLAGTDLILTAAASFLLASAGAFQSYGLLAASLTVFILLMILAVAVHHVFCVDTALNRWLGIAPRSVNSAGR